MNLPNSTEGNWAWRFETLEPDLALRLKDLSKLYGRN
jgi:4-alpha-glucanotransferase